MSKSLPLFAGVMTALCVGLASIAVNDTVGMILGFGVLATIIVDEFLD